jgi:ubiquitin C-terminal hydrolase
MSAMLGISKYNNINGVSCYMGSILHILQQIPIFADYIYNRSYIDNLQNKYKTEEKMKTTVIYELWRLFDASMNNNNISITPSSFKKVIGMRNEMWNEHRHQDSQEFFSFLISSLEDELGTKTKFIPGGISCNDVISYSDISYSDIIKDATTQFLAHMSWENFQAKEYSVLKNMFNGMTHLQNKCSCCGNTSNTFEPFTSLQIAIPINEKSSRLTEFTLEECLDIFIKEEQLDRNNMYTCDLCGVKNRSYKKTLIWRKPKVLVIHLKRFLTNNYGVRTQKIVNMVKYPMYDFDINKYINSESNYVNDSKYNLIGVNLHQEFGNGINMGHYTSLVKNRYDNNWYLFNDSKEPILITKEEQIYDKSAYLLFYYLNE